MGSASSRSLAKAHLQTIASSTHFDEAELKQMHRDFRKMTPSGSLDLNQFVEAYAMYFPIAEDSTDFATHVFRSFDCRSLGRLEFCDYARALSVMERGTRDEKIDWLFGVFDVKGDGTIDADELREVFTSLQQLVAKDRRASRVSLNLFSNSPSSSPPISRRASIVSGSSSPSNSSRGSRYSVISADFQLQKRDLEAQERAQAVFAEMDLNEDGRIDRHEFAQTVAVDENVRAFLEN